jgi:membrane associated rhomboid family serine protease
VIPIRDNVPTSRTPVVTIALIALNVAAYFLFQHGTLSLGDPSSPSFLSNLWHYAQIPFEVTHPGAQCVEPASATATAVHCGARLGANYPPTWLTVFTAMFMHGGLLHLGGNMLFLWIFGNNVEDAMGRGRFVLFYLLAGLAATALQVVVGPGARVPNIGASGAIAGVLAGYLVLFPRARVATVIFIIFFFTILELPALLFLGIWFLQQVLFGYFDLTDPTGGGGGVAYFAHIGGFAFGLLAVKLFAGRRPTGRRPPDRRAYGR